MRRMPFSDPNAQTQGKDRDLFERQKRSDRQTLATRRPMVQQHCSSGKVCYLDLVSKKCRINMFKRRWWSMAQLTAKSCCATLDAPPIFYLLIIKV